VEYSGSPEKQAVVTVTCEQFSCQLKVRKIDSCGYLVFFNADILLQDKKRTKIIHNLKELSVAKGDCNV
jgi:hypothetical protein